MKTGYLLNIIFSIFGMIGCAKTFSQEIRDAKESQEIIIKKKGDKDAKITVEITGNSIIINGKPLAEFKEDGITINNRKMIIKEGDRMTMTLNGNGFSGLENLGNLDNFHFDMDNLDEFKMINPPGGRRIMLGVMTDQNDKEGLKITEVVKDGAAEKAGLQKDDIITKIDDNKISTQTELTDFLQTKKEGDKVKVYFTRDGKKKDISATLQMKNVVSEVRINKSFKEMENPLERNGTARVYKYKNNAIEDALESRDRVKDLIFRMNGPKLGLKIQDTEQENGVKVLDVEKESLSATAGLQKDDIITAIGDKVIKNTDEAREALNANKAKSSYTMKVTRNGKDVLLTISVPKKLKVANL
jgi:serine protease Do